MQINTILGREGVNIEYKSAKGGFPNSFWETFSAFANTNGGTVILGVREKGKKLLLDGLTKEQVDTYKKKFWDDAHNKTCISVPLLVERDVTEIELEDGNYILKFDIPRAPYNLRPVYVTTNPMGHTYMRSHEGDYVCADSDVRQMFSDANHLMYSADARILKNYSMDDIDKPTLQQYRRVYASRHENHPWSEVSDEVFLENIGAYRKDRMTSEEGFTVAGILMFGKTASITDQGCMPWFFPDYREWLSDNPADRWTNRIYPDGTWEANLYQYFRRVLPQISHVLPKPFRLAEDGVTRLEYTSAHTALREAFANACIHASYTQMGNITIDRYPNRIVISNPGTMLVSLEEFYEGHYSVCRNPILQKMFVLIGIGEKAGSGADTIIKGWEDNDWKMPELIERHNPTRVEVILLVEETSDKRAINVETSDKRAINVETSDKTSDKIAKMMDYIRNNPMTTAENVAQYIGLSIPRTRHYLTQLVTEGRVLAHGANKNRTYSLE